MSRNPLRDGVVYTETVVHSAPERYAADAPYQIAIVEIAGEGRRTVRVIRDRVAIGDRVRFVEWREDVPVYAAILA